MKSEASEIALATIPASTIAVTNCGEACVSQIGQTCGAVLILVGTYGHILSYARVLGKV